MGTSTIKSRKEGEQREGFVFFTALLGNPSTGKTPAMKICQKAIEKKEQALNINPESSSLVNGNIFVLFILICLF